MNILLVEDSPADMRLVREALAEGEVLAEIKRDPLLLSIQVLILTSSSARRDVLKAYGAHANAYMVKPDNFEDFLALVGTIRTYWLHSVLLPSGVI